MVCWWGNWTERDRWGDLGLDGWIILGLVCGERVVYSLLVGKLEGKRPLGDLSVEVWRIFG